MLGCKLGCHELNRGSGFHSGIPPPPLPSSMYCPSSNGVTVETLRSRGVGLMSRLLWYDKRQFRQFLKVLVETRDIHFLITFFHSYLVFCNDPTNPFSFTGANHNSSCKLLLPLHASLSPKTLNSSAVHNNFSVCNIFQSWFCCSTCAPQISCSRVHTQITSCKEGRREGGIFNGALQDMLTLKSQCMWCSYIKNVA